MCQIWNLAVSFFIIVRLVELLLDRAHRPLFVGELDVQPQVAQRGPRRLLGLGCQTNNSNIRIINHDDSNIGIRSVSAEC